VIGVSFSAWLHYALKINFYEIIDLIFCKAHSWICV
jgi:hypothetical protein